MLCQFTVYCNKLIISADKVVFFFSSLVHVDHFFVFQGVSCFCRHFYIVD